MSLFKFWDFYYKIQGIYLEVKLECFYCSQLIVSLNIDNRDEIQIENNVELLGDDHFNDSEPNVQTFENFYEEPSAPYTKSYEPIYTLLDQIGEKLKFKCNKCPDEKIISSQVKSSWGLKRHMQSSHTIQDLEEFDSLHKKLGTKSL